jgi:hypothetical protein
VDSQTVSQCSPPSPSSPFILSQARTSSSSPSGWIWYDDDDDDDGERGGPLTLVPIPDEPVVRVLLVPLIQNPMESPIIMYVQRGRARAQCNVKSSFLSQMDFSLHKINIPRQNGLGLSSLKSPRREGAHPTHHASKSFNSQFQFQFQFQFNLQLQLSLFQFNLLLYVSISTFSFNFDFNFNSTYKLYVSISISTFNFQNFYLCICFRLTNTFFFLFFKWTITFK